MLTRDIDIAIPSVRPSVCLSRFGVVSKRLDTSVYFHSLHFFFQYETYSLNSEGVPTGLLTAQQWLTPLRLILVLTILWCRRPTGCLKK